MKGSTPTKSDKELWRKICDLGCIACLHDGIKNTHCVPHHIDGRTKPDSHKKVLPLCAQHHQHDDTDPAQRIGVHPYKARFEAKYGSQYDLLEETLSLINS